MKNGGSPADDDTSTTKDEGCEQQDILTMQKHLDNERAP
jgi:hypothetical protein